MAESDKETVAERDLPAEIVSLALSDKVNEEEIEGGSVSDGVDVTVAVATSVSESVIVDDVQLATLVDPVLRVSIPLGQGVHDSASVAFDHVSSGHGVGAVEFSGQKFPAPQGIADAEAFGQYVPGRQK